MRFLRGGGVKIDEHELDAKREGLLQALDRVATGSRGQAIDDCLEIVRRAKEDFKGSIEAVIAVRDIERLIELLKKGRA